MVGFGPRMRRARPVCCRASTLGHACDLQRNKRPVVAAVPAVVLEQVTERHQAARGESDEGEAFYGQRLAQEAEQDDQPEHGEKGVGHEPLEFFDVERRLPVGPRPPAAVGRGRGRVSADAGAVPRGGALRGAAVRSGRSDLSRILTQGRRFKERQQGFAAAAVPAPPRPHSRNAPGPTRPRPVGAAASCPAAETAAPSAAPPLRPRRGGIGRERSTEAISGFCAGQTADSGMIPSWRFRYHDDHDRTEAGRPTGHHEVGDHLDHRRRVSSSDALGVIAIGPRFWPRSG